MDVYLALIVATNLLFFAATLACVYLLKRRVRRLESDDGRVAALRVALINTSPAPEHRVDAATREAADGFRFCAFCAFANFERFRFCALCDEKISATITEAPRATQELATSRRARARRRGEWTRRVDVEGRVFWFRSAVGESARAVETVPISAVVLQFHTPANEVIKARQVTAANPETVNEHQPPLTGNGVEKLDSRSARPLDTQVHAATFTLVPASEANAAMFSDGSSLGSRERTRETLDLAAKDFPTKYAHFVVCTSSLLVPAEVEFLKLSVHRDYVVEQSVEHVSCIAKKNIRSFMRINFLDESGVDAGGVHREWFMLLNELLAGPSAGLFQCANTVDQSLYLNRNSAHDIGEDHLVYFYAVGRLVGRALLEGEALGFHLSLPLLKIVLSIPVAFSDLEHLDPEAYKSMQWIAENNGVDALGLTFSVTEQRGSEMVVVDLVPDGRNVDVTDENKREYLERRFHYLLFESVASQLYVFLKGVYEVIPTSLLAMFDPEEFDYVLCGSDEIDVTDWEMHSKHSKNLQHARALRWFWELVRDMPNEYRRRLLQFATGCSRVPLVGFKGLTSYDGRICPFTLKGVPYETSGQYIRSHACFNRLDLPLYTDRNELERILYATLDTEAYGFTTD